MFTPAMGSETVAECKPDKYLGLFLEVKIGLLVK